MIWKWFNKALLLIVPVLKAAFRWRQLLRTLVSSLLLMLLFRHLALLGGSNDSGLFAIGFGLGLLGHFGIRIVAWFFRRYLLARPELMMEMQQFQNNAKNNARK